MSRAIEHGNDSSDSDAELWDTAIKRIERCAARKQGALNLRGLDLKELPRELFDLHQLKGLDLAENLLEALPPEIARLQSLKTLSLWSNPIATLPKEFASLSALTSVEFYDHCLAEIPDSLTALPNLQSLGLTSGRLQRLPPSLGRLTSLRELNIGDNCLTSLPPEISELSQLRRLNVWMNRLTRLPHEIGELGALEWLQCGDNKLRYLPSAIGKMASLRQLVLYNNALRNLPRSLMELSDLSALYLHGNTSLKLPSDVLGPTYGERRDDDPVSPFAILDYYFRTRRDGRPLNEVKLILVGRGGAGKTSIIRRLVEDRFNPHEKETPGISITTWERRCSADKVRLHVWDFAGQEITHATHHFFLTERSVYLLVITGREGTQDRDADYWLRLVRSFGGDSPVIIVLNKQALHSFDLDRNALLERHPNIAAFVETDCDSALGISKLKKAIDTSISELEAVHTLFPREWVTIKNTMASMADNYLSYSRYEELCVTHGEGNPQAQAWLAGHLHRLGLALNYRDDPRLRHATVLNPHWVTNGIYSILRASFKGRPQGELHVKDLAKVLPGEKSEMREYLVELMRRFDLCFPVADTTGIYLVPQLLTPHQPELEDEWRTDPRALRLRYKYAAVPEGLLPRFIVRTYALSEDGQRWRNGVILRFEKATALVRADAFEGRTVDIVIRGPEESQQRLAGIVRENFARIHAGIKELQPVEELEITGQSGLYQNVRALAENESRNRVVTLPSERGDVAVDRTRELNRILPHAARTTAPRIRVFVSYSHKDEGLKNRLEMHLDLLRNHRLIDRWDDRRILPGQDWNKEIRRELQQANIVLFLVSTPFLVSGYIQGVEVKEAFARAERNECVIVPVILEKCSWQNEEWSKFQGVPKDGRPIRNWQRAADAWHNVEEQLRATIREIEKVSPDTGDEPQV